MARVTNPFVCKCSSIRFYTVFHGSGVHYLTITNTGLGREDHITITISRVLSLSVTWRRNDQSTSDVSMLNNSCLMTSVLLRWGNAIQKCYKSSLRSVWELASDADVLRNMTFEYLMWELLERGVTHDVCYASYLRRTVFLISKSSHAWLWCFLVKKISSLGRHRFAEVISNNSIRSNTNIFYNLI